jgi:type IV pilus assembly protein PilQ
MGMNRNNPLAKIYPGLIWVIVSTLIICSCTTPKKEEKDQFFETWRAKAAESKGSMAAPQPAPQPSPIPAPQLMPEKPAPPAERPLPTRKISLKMNNIDVAVLLRALARAADVNLILGENVRGNANVNITQAPWDQVFKSILRTYALTYSWEGNIIRVLTADEQEADLQREARRKDLKIVEPLETRVVPVKYADAENLKTNLESFLSTDKEGKPLGSILVDRHTNSLIIQAIGSDLATILAVFHNLDRPTPQVLIEAHIVEATKDTARELGIQWGGLVRTSSGNNNYYFTGRDNNALGTAPKDGAIDAKSGLVVDLPAAALAGSSPMTLGFIFENVGQTVITAELSALQNMGKVNILSSPSITTLDNQPAFIESGQDVPYQSVEYGEVKIEYKKAVLNLTVIPHVIDSQTLKMTIKVNKDDVDLVNQVQGNPLIRTKKAETNVTQANGQTIVIGGLNQDTDSRGDTGVPFLQDIPGLGYLFKKESTRQSFDDLLIFITPYILQETVAQQQPAAKGKTP